MCGVKIPQQDFALKGGLMRGIKIPQQDFALKRQGGAYARGGAYLRDTTVYNIISVGPHLQQYTH